MEHAAGVEQLSVEQADEQAHSMGLSYFRLFRTYHLVQPEMPRMSEWFTCLHKAHRYA